MNVIKWGKTCWEYANGQKIYVDGKNILRGLSAPTSIYMYMTIIFKDLFLWNHFANQSQTLCGASLGKASESYYKWSRSYNQDGRHAYK